jgi:glycosyltransferase involved in cell wall biosynthesis
MSTPRTIHLVNPLWNVAGGSEQRTLGLYRELSPHADVLLWTEHQPDAEIARNFPIQRVDVAKGQFPHGGTLVFVGIYQLPGAWTANASPRRAIVLYNTLAPQQLVLFMRQLFSETVQRVEIVYASEELRRQTKLRGIVEPSIVDLMRFAPRCRAESQTGAFTIGRLSREDARKHHPDDLPLYRELAAAGCRVRIMGGRCLAAAGPVPEGIELLPAKVEPAEDFLRNLNCFFYRTGPEWWETFGRVVHEAMACGLCVVCHNRGGYVTSIDHGRTGYLFETNAEALSIMKQLRDDRAVAIRVGIAAREAMEAMYSPAERAKVIEYYLM